MAFKFDGVADRCSAPIDFTGHDEMCFSMWWWWDGYANDDDLALELGVAGGAGSFYIDPNNSAGFITITMSHGGGAYQRRYNRSTFPANTWHHLFHRICWSSQTFDLWFNGTYQAPASNFGTVPGTGVRFGPGPLYVMHRGDSPGTPSLFGAGKVAELAIWLTQANTQYPDAQTLYQGLSPLRVNPRQLLAYYPMRDGSLRNYARIGGELFRTNTVATAPHDMPVNQGFVGFVSMYGTTEYAAVVIPPGDAATVYVDIQPSSSQVFDGTETASIYVDLTCIGSEGVVHTDAATVYFDLRPESCEWFVPVPESQFIFAEYTKWSQEAETKWSVNAQSKWQWTVQPVDYTPEEICT